MLREACTPWGIRASLTDRDNYSRIFTRDAVMAGIAGLQIGDEIIIGGLISTVEQLKALQGSQGQIASNFKIENDEVSKVSFGTLSPKIDSCTWYLIGVAMLINAGHLEKEDYLDSVTTTIDLLEGIEYNGKNLMYIPKGGNWADEYIYEGYILYDQLLRAWGLSLLGGIYYQSHWSEKASRIIGTVQECYRSGDNPYYHSSTFPGGVFDRFDLPAHSIAGIVMDRDDDYLSSALDWVISTFLEKEALPPVFYPVIDEQDELWSVLYGYHLYRFKNEPHHFHNGGIWWIWLGWLAVALSLRNKEEGLQRLLSVAFDYLEKNKKEFEFHEYISGDELKLLGTSKLCFTATGIIFMSLAKEGYDFSTLYRTTRPAILEPLSIRKDYFYLSKQIVRQLESNDLLGKDKLVIGVAGESGSGKSVTAKCLQIQLEKQGVQSLIIHQDGYYKLPPKENHLKRKESIDWVGVNELKLDLMQQHIDQFLADDETLDMPVVNYKANSIFARSVSLANKTVLIVEGVYAFFLERMDYKIFMSRTYHDTLENRRKRAREKYDPYVEQVLDIEHKIVCDQKADADAIITKEYELATGQPRLVK